MHLSIESREASWSAVASDSATPLLPKRLACCFRKFVETAFHSGTIYFHRQAAHRKESGVADARALPSHLCRRTPRRFAHLSVLSVGMLLTTAMAQEQPAVINGVKGVKQEAVEAIKNIAPPTVVPVNPPPPTGVAQPIPPPPPTGTAAQNANKVEGVKSPGQDAPPPPPPPPAAQGVNKVDGIQATPPNTVKGVPPPPAAAISTIRAVQGVQGIIAPKQLNLEAALLIKEDGKGTPAGGGAEGGKGKAAAAALLSGPPGLVPVAPAPAGDGRAVFQEFEKNAAPGS